MWPVARLKQACHSKSKEILPELLSKYIEKRWRVTLTKYLYGHLQSDECLANNLSTQRCVEGCEKVQPIKTLTSAIKLSHQTDIINLLVLYNWDKHTKERILMACPMDSWPISVSRGAVQRQASNASWMDESIKRLNLNKNISNLAFLLV